jgi:hypothetical protein
MDPEGTRRPPAAAKRMRAYRQRRREDLRYVRILLGKGEVDRLVKMGLLDNDERHDPIAVERAAAALLLDWALDNPRFVQEVARAMGRTVT